MNFRVRNNATDTGRIWQITVTDDQDTSGLYKDMKGTPESVYSHTSSDERIPYSNPINTGELRFGVWIEDSDGDSIVDSLVGADDRRYQISLQYKDDPDASFITEWRGYIVPDLTTYQEDSKPYIANIVCRDFSSLSGDYAPGGAISTYQTIITVLAGILDDLGLNRPIKAVTPFTNEQLTTSECYLHQVYMSRYQLQDGLNDGDRQRISKREALERLLRNHNLILFQSDGYFWLVNMTGMSDADSVFVTEYNASGEYQSDSTEDLSSTPSITTQSTVSISPAIKTVTTRYQHNGTVYGFSFVDRWQTDNSTDKVFSGVFISTGEQRILIEGVVGAVSTAEVRGAQIEVQIKVGQYYWDGGEWTEEQSTISYQLFYNRIPNRLNEYEYVRGIQVSTVAVPNDLDTDQLEITFFNPTFTGGEFPIANYYDFEFAITETDKLPENYIDYRESNTGDASVDYDIGTIYYGDRVTYNSRSGLREQTTTEFINGEWKRRGEALESSFQRLLILDILNFYKDTKELIQAETFSNYVPWKTVSYDGKDYFVTSSSCNLYTGRSSLAMLETAVSTDATDGIIDTPGKPPGNIGITTSLLQVTQNLNNDGDLPERSFDRSDIITQNVTTETFQISGDQNTTAVNVNLSSEEDFTLTGFDITNAKDGQEILLWINPSASSKRLLIEETGSSDEPIIVPNGLIIRRLSGKSVFRFKRLTNDSQTYWNLIYEVSLPPVEEEDPPIVDRVETPTFSPAPGTYTGDQDLTISCATSGATILYSTDGSDPTTTYTGAVTLTEGNSYTVRARATKAGLDPSFERVGDYVINAGPHNEAPNAPTFDPAGGIYNGNVTVDINTSLGSGGSQTVYYTTDGTEPDENSSVYSTSLTFTETTTLKAIAKYDAGTLLSDTTSQTYSIAGLSMRYKQGWKLISHPLKYPMSENSMRKIFNNGINTIYTYREGVQANLNSVSANLTNDLPAVKCEPGIGYWIKLPQDVDVNWGSIATNRYNLLSNDSPVAQRGNDIPYTWSVSFGNGILLAFNSVVDGVEYLRLNQLSPTSSYTQKIYLDEIVTRNYGATDYELSAKFSVDNAGSATVYLGIEEYDENKSSIGTVEEQITFTTSPSLFAETLTSTTGYYVRPYIKITETNSQAGGLKIYIREASFSAEPGLMTSVTQSVINGWNLVGAGSSISTITTDGSISSSIYTYGVIDDGEGYILITDPTKLRPGKGYYVNFSGATEYDIDES